MSGIVGTLCPLFACAGANAMRNQIKDTVSTAAKVKFVDYFPNDEGKSPDTAIVRFEDGSTADAGWSHIIVGHAHFATVTSVFTKTTGSCCELVTLIRD